MWSETVKFSDPLDPACIKTQQKLRGQRNLAETVVLEAEYYPERSDR